MPLTLKISQTCSLVYTVNIRKITTLLLQQIRYTFCQTLCTKRNKTADAGCVSRCRLLAICALSPLPVVFLSDALTTKPMHGSPAKALLNRCYKLRLELARWFTTWFQPAADEPPADRRNHSIPARNSVSSNRPLSVQLCRCTTAVILGGPWGINATPLW